MRKFGAGSLIYGLGDHRRSQDFWLGGAQTTNHTQWRRQKFSKSNFLLGKDIVEWKIWSSSLMALCQDFGKGRGRKLIVEKCKSLTWKTCWVSYCTQTYQRRGSGGRAPSRRWLWGSGRKAPSRWAIFVSFWKKKLFKSHWITFRTSSEPFQRTRFLTFQRQSKKFSCSILFCN